MKHTLRFQIVKSTILMVLTALVLSGIYFTYLRYIDLKKGALEKVQLSVEQMARSMNEGLLQLQDTSYALIASPILRQWNQNELSLDPSSSSYLLTVQELQDSISSTLMFSRSWTANNINAIYLFADDHFIRLFNRLPLPVAYTDAQFESVYQSLDDAMESSGYIFQQGNASNNIYYVRKMHNVDCTENLFLLFQLNSTPFCESITSSDYTLTTSVVYNDTVFFSSDASLIGSQLAPPSETQNIFYQSMSLAASGFSVHAWIPTASVYAPLWTSLWSYLVGLIVSVLVFGFLAGLISVSYTRFLKDLMSSIEHLRQSDFDTLMPEFKEPELHEISNTFNLMVQENNRLFHCIYQQELLLKDADIKLLQSQISPHFITNTLTAIGTKSLLAGNAEIYEMTSALSTMLNSSFRNTSEQSGYTTLEQELKYIDCYLKIQKFRFPDKFTYKVTCEDAGLLKLYIPRLSIEPFVENSFIHGIEEADYHGIIELNIRKSENTLLIEVTDNGHGFDPDSLDLSGHQTASAPNDRTHIGISNTNKRLKLLFGENYGVSFVSVPFIRTTASISVPILDAIPDHSITPS